MLDDNFPTNYDPEFDILIPPWLLKVIPHYGTNEPKQNIQFIPELANSRQEMYKSLELLHDHVKGVLRTCFVLIATSGIVLGNGGNGKVGSLRLIYDPELYKILGTVAIIIITIFVPKHCINSKKIIKLYYKVYVSSIIHVIAWHVKFGCAQSHGWILENIRMANKFDEDYPKREDRYQALNRMEYFIERRIKHKDFSYRLYSSLFNWIAILSGSTGIAITYYFISMTLLI